ncbi:unnamed protein product [Toxocara canis]|uniref:Bacteriocin n=1 Tax=Toxocara canis TaxID=6265 RepID=A0A183U071_TOXCA|nr:unnamed protein product [Toxocara canis]
MYDWGYGYGMDIGQNAGQDKQFAITAAHGSKSDWGNYNYGGHGEFSKGASFGIGAGERSGNAYENGWGNGWGWGVNKFQLPWAWSGLAAHNPWWWD